MPAACKAGSNSNIHCRTNYIFILIIIFVLLKKYLKVCVKNIILSSRYFCIHTIILFTTKQMITIIPFYITKNI